MPLPSIIGSGVAPGSAQPTWALVANNYDFSFFKTAGLTLSVPLFTMPRGAVLHGIKIKHSTAFAGPSISAYTISVGILGSLAKYASAFDVLQAVSSTTFQLSDNFVSEDDAALTQVYATATSVGANLNVATAGVVDIWAMLSGAPALR
jgi:hypothetical protein